LLFLPAYLTGSHHESAWHDRRNALGQDFEHEIEHYLAEANIILLLDTSDLNVLNYLWNNEIKNAMARHEC